MSKVTRSLVEQSPDALRRHADLRAVAAALGIMLDERGRGLCPFHDDHDPSLHVFTGHDGVPRFSCFPCGITEDVFGFVQRARGCSFSEAVEFLTSNQFPEVEHVKRRGRAKPVPVEDLPYKCSLDMLGRFVSELNWPVPAEFLRDLGWRTDGEHVIVPHYRRDGTVHSWKRRAIGPGQKWIARSGGTLDVLIGEDRDRGRRVVLVEGERDYASACWLLRDFDVDVLALPAGAQGPTDALVESLGRSVNRVRVENGVLIPNREVVIMFDADEAGRRAAHAWKERLGARARLVDLPDGTDVSDRLASGVTPEEFVALIEGKAWRPRREEPVPHRIADAFRRLLESEIRLRETVSDSLGIEAMEEPTWLVHGMIPSGGRIVALSGFTGSGKTFLCVDLALSVASGRPWLGAPVERGNVVYFAQEGLYDLKPRMHAWRLHHQVSHEGIDGFLAYVGHTLHLDRESDLAHLEEIIDAAEARLVVIDTLAVSLGEVDENSATEMRPVLASLRGLVKRTDTTLVLVAHTGWNTKRERGSSALRSEADTVLHVEGSDGFGTLTNPKQRSTAPFSERAFRLVNVPEAKAPVAVMLGVSLSIRDQILDLLRSEPWTLTRTDVEERVSGNAERVRSVLDGLVAEREIIARSVRLPRGASGRRMAVEVLAVAGTEEPKQ